MITILKNNTKIMTHKERGINPKLRRAKNEDLGSSHIHSKESRQDKSVMSKYSKTGKESESESRGKQIKLVLDYNDSRHNSKGVKKSMSKGSHLFLKF